MLHDDDLCPDLFPSLDCLSPNYCLLAVRQAEDLARSFAVHDVDERKAERRAIWISDRQIGRLSN